MNLKTFIFIFFSFVLLATLATGQTNPYNKLDKLKVNDLIAQKLEVQSTTKGAIPCPSMTQTQRNAIPTPLEGSCVFNQDSNTLNVYDGSGWVEVGAGGAGGGINNWETAHFYDINDVVIESNKIYQCNTAHTSSVFATDISKWTKLVAPILLTTEVSGVLPMANGGSEKALTPVLGGVVYTDGGSMEVLGAGTSGQLLKSNGAAAPEWMTLSVGDATFSGVLSLGKGGTNKNLTASNGAIAYSDADSIELLAPGTSGQVLQSNGAAAPSYVNKSISAKNENGSSVTLEEIQVSNNQLTQTDVNKHLLESGNSNILANPSFEHSTVSTSWTSSAGTLSAENSVVVNGKKSLLVTLSAQSLAITQDSTLYAAQFADGVQGLASVRVKTSLSGIRVCSRQAGVTSTTNCVNVQGNGKWGLYKVPMILGATSNGISIASASSLTGTVYLDDAFVGAVDLQATVDASKVAGEAYFAGTASCVWTRTSTTVGAFTTSATCPGPTIVTSTMGSWQTTDSDLPRVTINNLPAGTYKAKFIVRQFMGTAITSNPVLAINDGTTTCEPIAVNEAVTTATGQVVECTFIYNQSGNRVFELYGASPFNAVTVANLATAPRASTKFILEYFGSSSVYSSTNADTDWASCTPSSSQGFGTPTFAVQCKRQGGDLLMKGRFTPSATTAVEARLGLPLWNGVQLVSAGTSIIPALEVANGFYSRGIASLNDHGGAMFIEPSVAYLTFGGAGTFGSSSITPLTKANGNAVSSTETLSFNARIPIESWQQSNIIIGQFNGLESCLTTLDCTDVFSAKISATGVTSEENVDFLSGNCSLATNVYTCTFNASIFTVAPNCVISPLELSAINGTMGMINSQSSSSLVYKTVRHDSAALAAPVNLICQKQGADYVGKTAKAVASDQNVRVVGATGVDMQSVYFAGATLSTACSTSPCVIYRQVGSKITSVSRVAIGQYNLNGIDGTKYQCTGTAYNNAGTNRVAMLFDSSASSSTQATISSQGVDTSYNSIICIGIP